MDGAGSFSGPVDVYQVDPTSGQSSHWANFAPGTTGAGAKIELSMDAVTNYGPTPIAVASVFSPDFKRIAASITDTSNHTDVGWLGSDGAVTNVSKPLWSAGSFTDVPRFRNAQFATDGNFYFTSVVEDGNGNRRTTFMATSAAAPGTPAPVGALNQEFDWFWMNPNGTVTSMNAGSYWYQENVTKGVGSPRVESWFDATSWLGVDDQGGQVWLSTKLLPQDQLDVFDWGQDGKAVTPPVSGYTVSSPVVSPDKSTVAFIGRQGTIFSLFTVPVTGGTPQKVNLADMNLSSNSVIAAWK